jgi:hypothetical protein
MQHDGNRLQYYPNVTGTMMYNLETWLYTHHCYLSIIIKNKHLTNGPDHNQAAADKMLFMIGYVSH